MVFGDYPDDDPAHPLEHFQTLDVFDILTSVGPMVIAVVFDRDHQLRPPQIEVRERKAVHTQHRYLRLRPRKTRIDEQ